MVGGRDIGAGNNKNIPPHARSALQRRPLLSFCDKGRLKQLFVLSRRLFGRLTSSGFLTFRGDFTPSMARMQTVSFVLLQYPSLCASATIVRL